MGKKLKITERALVQRLNRAMSKHGLKLKKSRTAQTQSSVGEWFILDTKKNFVVYQDVDLGGLAKKWKVLADWEELEKS